MKLKALNRNSIKVVALLFMLIDHIGFTFYGVIPYWLYVTLRILGRISFPLFAYFVAEGFFYTRSKPKYILKLLVFALISQIPYHLLFAGEGANLVNLNILFTFVLSVSIMAIYDKTYREAPNFNKAIFIVCLSLFLILVYFLGLFTISVSYGVYGILLPFLFYAFKPSKQKQIISFVIALLLHSLNTLLVSGFTDFFNYVGLFSLLNIIFIVLYNGQKGKLKLQWLFYWFYPLHLLVLYLISTLL